MAVGRYFNANGLPFFHAQSPFIWGMVITVENCGEGGKPPSYKKLRTNGLNKYTDSLSLEYDPIHEPWQKSRVCFT